MAEFYQCNICCTPYSRYSWIQSQVATVLDCVSNECCTRYYFFPYKRGFDRKLQKRIVAPGKGSVALPHYASFLRAKSVNARARLGRLRVPTANDRVPAIDRFVGPY